MDNVSSRARALRLVAVTLLYSANYLYGQRIGAGDFEIQTRLSESIDNAVAGCYQGSIHEAKQSPEFTAGLTPPPTENACSSLPVSFALKTRDLPVFKVNGGVLFAGGMTIDADGAPNAYAPKNRGLDYTANARNASGWVALVTNAKGRPVIQRTGPYRGYYVSTTSLQRENIRDPRNPKKYLDATRIPYIALPADFARQFGIALGDFAVIVNNKTGRLAYAIYGDVGPKGRVGEGSIALANRLGIPSNPRHDSVPDGITYLVFPGSGGSSVKWITLNRINSSGSRLYRTWLAQRDCVTMTSTQ